jgi:hypothetical protein
MPSAKPTADRRRLLAVGLTALLATTGCGSSETDVGESTPPVQSSPATPPSAAAPTPPFAGPALSQSDADSHSREASRTTPTPRGDSADDEAAEALAAEYAPPYPDRVDLFVAPKRSGGATTAQRDDPDAVELLGFVTVDEPKAILSINGQVTPLAAGGSEFGVEVVSIAPPKAVLQRGRQRWQVSIEN